VDGNSRERVKVFGREAKSFPLMELLTEGCSDFREKGDDLSLGFLTLLINSEKT